MSIVSVYFIRCHNKIKIGDEGNFPKPTCGGKPRNNFSMYLPINELLTMHIRYLYCYHDEITLMTHST